MVGGCGRGAPPAVSPPPPRWGPAMKKLSIGRCTTRPMPEVRCMEPHSNARSIDSCCQSDATIRDIAKHSWQSLHTLLLSLDSPLRRDAEGPHLSIQISSFHAEHVCVTLHIPLLLV